MTKMYVASRSPQTDDPVARWTEWMVARSRSSRGNNETDQILSVMWTRSKSATQSVQYGTVGHDGGNMTAFGSAEPCLRFWGPASMVNDRRVDEPTYRSGLIKAGRPQRPMVQM